jgi:hypothetical protein
MLIIRNPFLDVGANIGVFTIAAVQAGNDV